MPVAPRVYDILAKPPNRDVWVQIQVKTARARPDRNDVVVVYAKKNNGTIYTLEEAEYIIGVFNGKVYIFKNREIGEYWVHPLLIDEKWTLLPL